MLLITEVNSENINLVHPLVFLNADGETFLMEKSEEIAM